MTLVLLVLIEVGPLSKRLVAPRFQYQVLFDLPRDSVVVAVLATPPSIHIGWVF